MDTCHTDGGGGSAVGMTTPRQSHWMGARRGSKHGWQVSRGDHTKEVGLALQGLIDHLTVPRRVVLEVGEDVTGSGCTASSNCAVLDQELRGEVIQLVASAGAKGSAGSNRSGNKQHPAENVNEGLQASGLIGESLPNHKHAVLGNGSENGRDLPVDIRNHDMGVVYIVLHVS